MNREAMGKKFRKLAGQAPSIMVLVIILFKFMASSSDYSNATETPDKSTGHTIPIYIHGRTIYLTQAQIEQEKESPFNWSNLALVAAACAVVIQRFRQSNGSKDAA